MLLARRPPAFYWRTLRESGGERRQEAKKNSQDQGTVVRGQREKILNRLTGDKIRDLKTRVGRECSISRRRARLYRGGIHVGGARGGSHSFTSGDTEEGAAPRVRAAKSSEFGEEKL